MVFLFLTIIKRKLPNVYFVGTRLGFREFITLYVKRITI